MEYKIIIDQSVIDEYNERYLKLHPRTKNKPIEKPYHPSINEWCILPRIRMNALKQKHKEFIVWLINKLGYNNLMLDNFEMIVTIYKKTRIRSDIDNYALKFWNDGFTESGFFVDDDYKHLKSITTTIEYDKEWPRTEILVKCF